MNPAQRLEAAIEKLERLSTMELRSQGVEWHPGPWTAGVDDANWDGVGIASSITDADGEYVGQVNASDDADLIVTLHRTIDAQLMILRNTVRLHGVFLALDKESMWLDSLELAGELALADAILGSDS